MLRMPMNRRSFLRNAAIAPIAARHIWRHTADAASSRLLFVGTRTDKTSKGIYAYHWNPANGELTSLGLAAETPRPTFLALHPSRQYLYAANELMEYQGKPSGAVSAFRIDHAAGRLHLIDQVTAEGSGTCNVNTSLTGQSVFCANYNGGSSTSFRVLANGSISQPVSHFQYHGHGPNLARQASPHAHRVTPSPDDRYLLVNDLGLDRIHIYHLDAATAQLTPAKPNHWQAFPGSGPRALRFHPNGHVAYVVFEMGSAVQTLHWDRHNGTLHAMQPPIPLTPAGYKGPKRGCDIVLDRKARFAYVPNRDYNCMVTFSVAYDGKLTLQRRSSCGGKIPRHLALDPTERWLLVANQNSDNISVFARDPETGKLEDKPAHQYPISIPQCLVFA